LPFSTLVEPPSECIEGEAELDVYFSAPDFGRKCPGIWQGQVGHVKRRVPLRHPGEEERIAPTASPGVLECSLSAAGPNVTLKLHNPTDRAWRARTVPTLELVPRGDFAFAHWSPLSLGDPPAPLAIDQTELLDLPAHGDLVRTVNLSDLAWSEDFLSEWPSGRLDTLPEGS
jgi:hypothetical protein